MTEESKPKRKRGGRVKGQTNKFTKSIKDTFEGVFKQLQQNRAANAKAKLSAWARENPGDFYKLAVRLIPAEIVGAGGLPLVTPQTINFNNLNFYQLSEEDLRAIQMNRMSPDLIERLKRMTNADIMAAPPALAGPVVASIAAGQAKAEGDE